MTEFKKQGLYDGAGSEDDGYWFSTEDGKHIHAEKGQSPKEAVDAWFKDKNNQPLENKKKKSTPKLKNIIKKLNFFKDKPVGTYDYHTGELVNLTDGYMVTFHQNEPDENGHYKSHFGRYTDEEYDNIANKFAKDNDAEVYIGVFDSEPEISFRVKSFKQAMKLMVEHNQDSFWSNEEGKLYKNYKRDKNKNPLQGE